MQLRRELLRLARRHRSRQAPRGAPVAPDLQGKLAVANAKLAYQHYLETFAGARWEFLAGKGARPQRCLWASTSTKNPAYPDTIYVAELIGPDVVNTMPLETIEAFQDHGVVVPDTLLSGLDEARRLLADLAAAGVDYDDVTATLEAEGVQKFADSFAGAARSGIEASAARSSPPAERPAATEEPMTNPLAEGLRLRRRRRIRASLVDLRRLGRSDAAEALPGALRAGLPASAARAGSPSSASRAPSRRRRSSGPR